MGKKQRILLVHNYYKIPGGEDTVVNNEKRLLEENGHCVFLYTRSNKEMEDISALQKLFLPFSSIFSLRTYKEIRKFIQKENIDLVHVHNTLTLISPSVYYAAFSCGVPVVQTMHNFRLLCPAATFVRNGRICEDCVDQGLGCAVRYGCYRGSREQTLVNAAILKLHRMLGTYRKLFYICLTEFNKEKLLLLNQKGRNIVREQNIFVKSNFIWRPEIKEPQKKDQYVYVGRLDAIKGIRFLLEAWREFPDKKLIICGSGPEEAWIKKYIQENQMSQVECLGQTPYEEVLNIIGESRALVMPTLCYEGQGLVLLESYAVGTPVLASDLGNPGNITISGVTGYHFTPGDVESLKEAVKKLETKTEWDTKSIYEKYYAPEANYEKLKQIYDYAGKAVHTRC
ncbi:MAG TPA: glycosyltransferase family 4 protein [Candidatus Merdisoma merdipullorum]|nr:glycosyltransferase family 4 protein [Candidatus Merdisoma merdipullorum]